MTSRERIRATWEGRAPDHLPLTTWSFGLRAPAELRWERDGRPVRFWYSQRMEHLHTLPEPWSLEDDFARALAWRRWGVDDILDVSVPWSLAPGVRMSDSAQSSPEGGTAMTRTYDTPAGTLRHVVRRTQEQTPEGWVVQPDHVPLFEDFNIPRAVKQAVATADDVPGVRFLYASPDEATRGWLGRRLDEVGEFARREGVAVQAWSAFGMDAAVWLCGTEGAVLLAMDEPEAFERLTADIGDTDVARTALAAAHPAVDLIVERGWYSSTDFWSPALFDRMVLPQIKRVAEVAHRGGKRFGYVMTTGVGRMAARLADAGVDVLYFADPVQDRVDLETLARSVGDRMTLVGGTNALSLAAGAQDRIATEVERFAALRESTPRLVLHPVDALFPDTPEDGIRKLVEAWRKEA